MASGVKRQTATIEARTLEGDGHRPVGADRGGAGAVDRPAAERRLAEGRPPRRSSWPITASSRPAPGPEAVTRYPTRTFTAAGAAPPSAGAPAKLQHAYLELREPPSDGSTAATPSGVRIGRIDFQFNPKELSLTKNAKW